MERQRSRDTEKEVINGRQIHAEETEWMKTQVGGRQGASRVRTTTQRYGTLCVNFKQICFLEALSPQLAVFVQ